MARAALGWDQRQMAERAGLSPETIKRAETDPEANLSKSTMLAITQCLDRHGVLMEMSFKRGLVVRLSKTAEAKKRVLEALAAKGTVAEKLRRAEKVIADYRAMAITYYEGEADVKGRVLSWLEDLKGTLRIELGYLGGRNDPLAEALDKFVGS